MKFLNNPILKNNFNKDYTISINNKIKQLNQNEFDKDRVNTNLFSFIKRNFLKKNNKTFVDMFLRNSSFSGKKLKIINCCNLVSLLFFANFIKKSTFLSNKFSNYNIFYNFSKSNEFFFDFNYILENVVNLNESIFTTKVSKSDKRSKKKVKSKFNLELKYLNRVKRQSNVIKLLNLYANNFNYYKLHERLLTSVMTTLFDQKNSDMYKKKIYTYNTALKKKSI